MQIAQRIHQVLLREIGHAIEVERLLTDAHYARDVLLVCDAMVDSEARPLATQFRQPPMPMPMPAGAGAGAGATGSASAPGHVQRPTDGSRHTSGFGVTQPPPLKASASGLPRTAQPPAGHPERHRHWLARWLDSH